MLHSPSNRPIKGFWSVSTGASLEPLFRDGRRIHLNEDRNMSLLQLQKVSYLARPKTNASAPNVINTEC